MRIVSGKYRGMKLVGFEGRDIRPTADRVKESLFNILRESVVGADVLDLFCGICAFQRYFQGEHSGAQKQFGKAERRQLRRVELRL